MLLNQNIPKDQERITLEIIPIHLPCKINLFFTISQISPLQTARDAAPRSSVCRALNKMAGPHYGGVMNVERIV